MCQFVECNFFTNYQAYPQEEESLVPDEIVEDNSSDKLSHSQLTLQPEDSSHFNQTQRSSKRPSITTTSENHNMVKQLIITIKQMNGKFIEDIGCNYTSRQIISETWKVFEKTKKTNKDLLKAMFDRQVNQKLINKAGLGYIFNKYGSYEYQNAMEELRTDMLLRMRTENLKSHLFNRNLKKRDHLSAYVQYFVEEQLKKGIISSRFSYSASKRMKQILKSNKSQNDFIDYYLDSSIEVSDRFTSQQATY